MKKPLSLRSLRSLRKISWLMPLFFPLVVFAQANVEDEINAELDRLQTGESQSRQTELPAQAPRKVRKKVVEVETVSAEPVIVAQQAPQQIVVAQPQPVQTYQTNVPVHQAGVQKQPTTIIEASPLTESRVEKLRRARMDSELQTEQKIVEKLETSRMDDEQRRADALFGNKFDNLNKKDSPPEVPVSQVPVQAVAPAPPVQTVDKETLRGEIGAALAELNKKEEPKDTTYFGLLAGVGDYPRAVNVKPEYALGFAIGKRFHERMVVEGSFIYSNFRVEQNDQGLYYWGSFYPRITEMDQYNTGLLVKYQLLEGTLRPAIGGIVSYTYRSFTDRQFAVSDQSATSHAVDFGALIGADIELSQTFSLGIEYRTMWNLTSRVDSGFQRSYQQNYLRNETPIERLNYYTLGIVGRASF